MFANIVPCQAISLVSENVLQHIPAIPSHEHTTFPNFSKNLLNEVNLVHLNKWLVQQKAWGHIGMQIHTYGCHLC